MHFYILITENARPGWASFKNTLCKKEPSVETRENTGRPLPQHFTWYHRQEVWDHVAHERMHSEGHSSRSAHERLSHGYTCLSCNSEDGTCALCHQWSDVSMDNFGGEKKKKEKKLKFEEHRIKYFKTINWSRLIWFFWVFYCGTNDVFIRIIYYNYKAH